jgi:soluble lytic murein transglycosylase-like protein
MRERELRALARQMAERYGLDPDIFIQQIQTESSFDPTARNRRTGATGLGQVMAATAQDPGYGVTPLRDRLDPVENLRFSAEYMSALLNKYDGDYRLALAAYNAGPGKVDQAGGVPGIEETQNYIAKIMGGQLRPVPRPMNLGREEGMPMRPEPRPDPNSLDIMARPHNMGVRQSLRPQMRPEGIAGLMW